MGTINYKTRETGLQIGVINQVIISFPFEYNVKLAILKAWPLKSIRSAFDRFLIFKYPPFIGKLQFRTILGLEKNLADFAFECLDYRKTGFLSVYEIFAALVQTAHANYENKIRFYFNLFDFDGNQSIDREELTILIITFYYGYESLVSKHKIPVSQLCKVADTVFAAAEFNLNGKLSISELGNWVEVNETIMKLLHRSEPQATVFDKDEIFLPFPRSTRSIEPLVEKYLKKKKFSLPGETQTSSMIKSQSAANLGKYHSLVKLGKAPSTREARMKMVIQKQKELKLPRVNVKSASPPSRKAQVITINGKCYSKKEILQFKDYFQTINDNHTGEITLEEYVKALSETPHMKRVAVSLFNYLDSKGTGKITLQEMLLKMAPGATKADLDKLMSWVDSAQKIRSKAQLHYRNVMMSKNQGSIEMSVGFKQIKDFIHIFAMYDKDKDGLLDLSDFKRAYSSSFSNLEIEKLFKSADVNETGVIDLKDFIYMMLPRNYTVAQDLYEEMCVPYLQKLYDTPGCLGHFM